MPESPLDVLRTAQAFLAVVLVRRFSCADAPPVGGEQTRTTVGVAPEQTGVVAGIRAQGSNHVSLDSVPRRWTGSGQVGGCPRRCRLLGEHPVGRRLVGERIERDELAVAVESEDDDLSPSATKSCGSLRKFMLMKFPHSSSTVCLPL